jgi:hypothetical protein
LTVIKQAPQIFNVEIFHPRELNELEVREQYYIKFWNRCAASEN